MEQECIIIIYLNKKNPYSVYTNMRGPTLIIFQRIVLLYTFFRCQYINYIVFKILYYKIDIHYNICIQSRVFIIYIIEFCLYLYTRMMNYDL